MRSSSTLCCHHSSVHRGARCIKRNEMNSGAMETALDCSSEPMLLRRLLLLRLPSDPVLVKVFLERRVSALCRLQSIRSDPIDSAMFRLLVSSLACLGKHLSLSGIPIWCLSSFGFCVRRTSSPSCSSSTSARYFMCSTSCWRQYPEYIWQNLPPITIVNHLKFDPLIIIDQSIIL
jgi:hypothetical protein